MDTYRKTNEGRVECQTCKQARQIMKYFEVHSIELTCNTRQGAVIPRRQETLEILTRALGNRLTPTEFLEGINLEDEED